MKKQLLFAFAAMVLGSTAVLPTQAIGQINVGIVIGNAPPPVRYEVVPSARRGYEWAPGYWNWNGRQHIWAGGHWERSRPGYHYQRPEWRQGNGGWQLERGGWQGGGPHHDKKDKYDKHDKHDKHGRGQQNDHRGGPDRGDHDDDRGHR